MSIKLAAPYICLVTSLLTVLGADARPLRVVTSFYPVYVAALNVTAGVEGVDVHNLAGTHIGCLHDYRLTAGDARRLADADILLANGLGMETFLDQIRAQYPRLKIVEVSGGIPLLGRNPHAWTSPSGARRQADAVARALSAADPANAGRYAANAAVYDTKLSALEDRAKSVLAPFAGTPVVALHEAFLYFARDTGLDVVGVIEREPGREPGAGQLADTIDRIRAKKVKLILAEPQYSDRAARTIARETGAEVRQFDPVVTGPPDPAAAREAYLQAMEKNLEVLRESLR